MLGGVVHSEEFQRLLATPSRSRSDHFAVHYVASADPAQSGREEKPSRVQLSTDDANNSTGIVDNLNFTHRLGTVLPKRHARRSVTRNLLRRQIRAAMLRHLGALPAGTWLVRLRSPFSRTEFTSAASPALRLTARAELDAALARAAN